MSLIDTISSAEAIFGAPENDHPHWPSLPAGELAFIDPGVSDIAGLLDGLRREVRAIVLDGRRSAARQIADALEGERGAAAIHIIAHGAPGEVSFSAGPLSLATIADNSGDLARIGDALGCDGELLLWCCDTGRGELGERFVETLSWATGALVGAASGPVGAAARGGRWDLDVRLGAGFALPPLTTRGIAAYHAVMTAYTWIGPSGTTNKPKSGTWDNTTTSNWSPAAIPGSGDTVTLGSGSGAANYTVTLGANVSVSGITINAAVTAVLAVGTDTLTVGSGGITLSGSTDSITIAGGTITDSGSVSLATGSSISGSGTLSATGGYSGTGTLQASAGTLDVSGTISSGVVLSISSASASNLKIEGTATSAAAISLTSSNQTLEIGASGALTISAAETVAGGTVKLDGGTLTDASGITFSSGSITGLGKIAAAITGSGGTLTASGGTLEVTGAITNSGSLALAVGSSSTDKLLLDATSAATSLTFSGTTGTLELNTSGALTLTNALAVGANTVKLDGAATTQLTDSAGLTITGGTISGTGTVAGNTGITGSGTVSIPISNPTTVKASGGTLTLNGTVSSGAVLQIDTTANSHLTIGGTATSLAAISISNAAQTLEVASSGALTISAAESITNGTITLSGGSLTSSAGGLTVGSGATLSGNGTVTVGTGAGTHLSGSGSVQAGTAATGGTLIIAGTVDSGLSYTINTATATTLQFNGTATTGAISVSSATQTLAVGAAGALTINTTESITNGKITVAGGSLATSGLTVGSGATLSGNGAVTGAITLSGGTITQSTSTFTLPAITGSGTINGAITNSAITASGSTLTFNGTLGGTSSLAIANVSGSILKLNNSGASFSAITVDTANKTLEIGANTTLTGTQTVTSGTLTIDSGATLTDTSGLTLSGGTVSGTGTVAASTGITGSGTVSIPISNATTVKASGGTLTLNGTVGSAAVLQIDTTPGSHLTIGGTAAPSGAIAISSGSQTLEVASGGALTIGTTESIGGGTISLSGGSLTTSGLTVGGGATLSGNGTVSGAITLSGGTITQSTSTLTLPAVTGSGTINGTITNAAITASGAPLTFNGSLGTGSSLAIANLSGSILKLNNSGASFGAIAVDAATKTLEIGANTTLTGQSVAGGTLQVDSGATLSGAVTVSSGTLQGAGTVSGAITLSGGTVAQSGGTTFTVGNITGKGSVTGSITNSTITALGGTLTFNGTLGGTSSLAIASGSASTLSIAGSTTSGAISISSNNQTLNVASGGALTLTGPESITNGQITLSGGTLTGSSGITVGTGATFTVSASSALSVGSGTSGLTNSAAFNVTAGTLTLSGDFTETSTGTATISSGATLSTSGAFTVNSGGQLTVSGTLTETGTAAFSNAGTLTLSGGTVQATSLTAAALSNTGTITSNGVSALSDSHSGISNSGTVTVTGGTLTATGVLNNTGGTINANGGTLTDASGFANGNTISGTVSFAGGTIDVSGATTLLTNGATSFSFGGGTLMAGSGGFSNASGKTITVGSGTNTLSVAGGSIANAGTVTLSGGSLIGSGGALDNSGTITMAAGSSLSDTTGISDSGLIQGAGTIYGAVSGSGMVKAQGGELELVNAIAAGPQYQVNGADSSTVLQVDDTIANNVQFAFLQMAGELGIKNDDYNGSASTMDVGIAGLNIGSGNGLSGSTIATSFIDIEGHPVTVTSDPHGSGTTATIHLSDGAVIDLTGITGGFSNWYVNTSSDAHGGTDLYLSQVPCFCRGTLILTPFGEMPVELLEVGDRVATLGGEWKRIVWIGNGSRQVTSDNSQARPLIVRAGALADGVPRRDLYLTRGHSLYIDGLLIPVEHLVNERSILWDDSATEVEFYHIELEDHDVLLAEGAPAESYRDDGNRQLFDNPEPPRVAAANMPHFAPVLTGGPEVDQVWQRLLDRSGFVRPETTDDPDLHLVADGKRIEPYAIDDRVHGFQGVYHFRLEEPANDLTMVSRLCVPTRLGLRNDPRSLGVAVRSIRVRGASRDLVLEHDSIWLAEGFNNPELTGRLRWTAGVALLPRSLSRLMAGPLDIAVEVVCTAKYPTEAEHPPAQTLPPLPTTTDPDLLLVAAGRRLRPLYREGDVYIFAVPHSAAEVRLLSRAGISSELQRRPGKPRALGVQVERIVLRSADETRELPLDHPCLSQGWWEVEHDAGALRRWTSGEAVLALPQRSGSALLEIQVCGGARYLLPADADEPNRERRLIA